MKIFQKKKWMLVLLCLENKGKVEGKYKVHPRTGHEGPNGENTFYNHSAR
jgi:hypothetical protein